MRELNSKEQGELDFWIDYVNGGCERETGIPFFEKAREGAGQRMENFIRYAPGLLPADGKVWLDLGAGPFSVLQAAPEGVTRIMLDPLTRHYARYELIPANDNPARNIYLESLGEELSLLNESVDAVFCTNALDHVYDPFNVMKEMVRILRPGGFLVIETDVGGVTDELHPHALEITGINNFLKEIGMEIVYNSEGGERRSGAIIFCGIYKRTEMAREHFPLSEKPPRGSLVPVLVEQGYNGFNIMKLESRYETVFYGIPQNDGAFSYKKVEAGEYKVIFEGDTIEKVKESVVNYFKKQKFPELAEEGFCGFNIIRYGNQFGWEYFGIRQSDGAFYYDKAKNREYEVFFEGKSVEEVKEAITLLLNVRQDA